MNSSNKKSHLYLDSLNSLNNFATTNPITNRISIPRIEEVFFNSLVDEQKYPQELLSVYLHEQTHYNCFDSYVGWTISYLGLKIDQLYSQIKTEKLFSEQHTELHNELFELVIRYYFVIEFIRPFAEGIALFAQFDDYLGDSDCISKTLKLVFNIFVSTDKIKSTIIEDEQNITSGIQKILNTFLVVNRFSDKSIGEKLNLLSQPFSCSNKNGSDYLPGYIFVKTLWSRSVFGNNCSRFLDKSLFITYLINFFFSDFGLVGVLLSENTKGKDSTNAIIDYFTNRVQHFYDVTNDSLIHEYEQYVTSPENKNTPKSLFTDLLQPVQHTLKMLQTEILDNEYCFHFKTSKKLFRTGIVLYAAKIVSLQTSSFFEDSSLKDLSSEYSWILSQRMFISLGYYQHDIEIIKNRRGKTQGIRIDNKQSKVYTQWFSALKGVKPGKGKGRTEFFYLPAFECQGILTFREDELVSVYLFSNHKSQAYLDKIEQDIIQYFKYYQIQESNHCSHKFKNLQSNIRNLYTQVYKTTGTDWIESLDYLYERTEQVKDSFYCNAAFSIVKDEHINASRSLMEEFGLSKIFQNSEGLVDRNLMKKFVKFSLINSFVIEKESILHFMEMTIDEFDDFHKQLIACENSHNLPLVLMLDKIIICLV